MSIAIDKKKCIGCGRCKNVCPGNLIKLDADNRAFIKYPKDCWGCTSCIRDCPAHAIEFFLGADIGGMGSLVHTERNGKILKWIIEKPTDETVEIDIDTTESNKY